MLMTLKNQKGKEITVDLSTDFTLGELRTLSKAGASKAGNIQINPETMIEVFLLMARRVDKTITEDDIAEIKDSEIGNALKQIIKPQPSTIDPSS